MFYFVFWYELQVSKDCLNLNYDFPVEFYIVIL